jgi:hypothetical protein
MMIVARVVFHAKFGKADDVVTQIKTMVKEMPAEQRAAYQPRVLTDISGRFDTVVFETTHANLAALEQARKAMIEQSRETEETSPLLELIETGRNEYWTIE